MTMNRIENGTVLINGESMKLIRIEDTLSKKKKKNVRNHSMESYMVMNNTASKDDEEVEQVICVPTTDAPRTFGRNNDRFIIAESLENVVGKNKIKRIPWNRNVQNRMVKDYCKTVYGSQGGEQDEGFIYMPYYCAHWTREAFYTSFTRFKKRVFLLGNREYFANAINHKGEVRNSEFGELALSKFQKRVKGARWQQNSEISKKIEIHKIGEDDAKTWGGDVFDYKGPSDSNTDTINDSLDDLILEEPIIQPKKRLTQKKDEDSFYSRQKRRQEIGSLLF